jgi:hypothetical protein
MRRIENLAEKFYLILSRAPFARESKDARCLTEIRDA